MELFIAEKPSVGKAIAAAIGATESKNGYMEGHLVPGASGRAGHARGVQQGVCDLAL